MTTIRNFADVQTALATFIPPMRTEHGAYTLERMATLMEHLGNPQEQYKVLHIAGTSGKSSTAYYLSSLLAISGVKVGMTVSPYVDTINERVQIGLNALPEDTFCEYLTTFLGLIESAGVKPLYFEVLVAFAYWVFAQEKVEYAVIEVGMGGLLDPTNVVKNSKKVCVITDIGLDHTHVLGKEITAITAQKAGIVKPHNTVFVYDQGEEVMAVIREVCDQVQSELHEVTPQKPSDLPSSLPLFQKRNWYLAYTVYQYIARRYGLVGLSEQQLAQSVATYIPGRMEILHVGTKTLVLDGAHNEQKLQALCDSVQRQFPGKEFAALVGMAQRSGSRPKHSIEIVARAASHVIFSAQPPDSGSPKHPVQPIKLAEYAHKLGYDSWEIVDDLHVALDTLLAREEEVLVITGSFYLVNYIRTYLRN